MREERQNVLDAVGILAQYLGHPPSISEVARFCGQPRMTAYHHLRELRRAKLVTNEEGQNRTLRLTEAGRARLSKVVVL
ncbi:MAG: helix-turn-helix domain-containing protein [Dehalococcoidia bacterium]